MLVLAAAGGGLLHAKGQISLAAAVVAPGLMVLAIILFMGAVSGAHLNPVVTSAFTPRAAAAQRTSIAARRILKRPSGVAQRDVSSRHGRPCRTCRPAGLGRVSSRL